MSGSPQTFRSTRRLVWLGLAGWLMVAAEPARAEDQILLSHDELQAWADARLQPRQQLRQPLWLAPLANDSATSTDESLRDAGSSMADIERGGVPLSLLDALLAGQLAGSGRYELNAVSAQTPQLQVRITRYHPAHRQGDESSLSQAIKSRWHSWFADEPLPVYVTLTASWHDPINDRRRQVSITAASDSCLRLEQAPVTASTPAPAAFTETYRHSAIGQASLAAFNRLLAWLDERNEQDAFALTINSVRGNRLLLRDPSGLLQPGEELALFHRDFVDRRIGSIRISLQRADQQAMVEAWPITLAAGSIRPGDEVRLQRPATGPLITPALAVPGPRCAAQAPDSVAAEQTMAPVEQAHSDAVIETLPPPPPADAELPQS